MKYEDLSGKRFVRLLVIKKVMDGKNYRKRWLCKCDCGNEKVIDGGHLKSGHTQSCGCLNREKIIAGNKINKKTHGMSHSKVYKAWDSMRQRCNNKNNRKYKNYGGRGISVCYSWRKFENFYKDMEDSPNNKYQLDRRNNALGYSPVNCRWVTSKTNNRNKRNNVLIFIGGKIKCVSEWAIIYGIKRSTVDNRLINGWDSIKAITTSVSAYQRKYKN